MKIAFISWMLGFLSLLNAHNMSVAGFSFDKIEAAIEMYDTEIKQQENDYQNKSLASLYCERGDLKFAKKDFRAALGDYQKVTSYIEDNQLSNPSYFIKGICGSLFCYENLNDDEAAKDQFNKLVYHVSLLGNKIENIDWFRDSPIYPMYMQNPNRYIERNIQQIDLPELTPEEHCILQCNGYAVAASFACGKVPNLAIQFLCYGCIFGLEQLCLRCCKGDGFWENCVKGLRRLFHDPEHPEKPAPHPYE